MADNYKFPDEAEESNPIGGTNLEIEIIDDTPPEDKGREALPQDIVDELEKDDLQEYSEKVKKRLGQLKKVWHDERRAKEVSTREKDEALRVAQSIYEENKQLKQRLGHGEKLIADGMTKEATSELALAKESLKQAYDSGDGSLIADAQEALTDAKLKIRDVKSYEESLQSNQNGVKVQSEQAPVDRKAEAWSQQNKWFGSDDEMTALALGLHEKLVKSGVDPSSDDYYRRVDESMRKRFPENFQDEQTIETEKPVQRKAANVVAPATRSTAPTKVRLTNTQLALAKKLGVSPEVYAKEVIKLGNYNG
jgi:hypothetical protein